MINYDEYSSYLQSTFGQTLVSDANDQIAQYYNDLSTTVTALSDLDIALSFTHGIFDQAVFRYGPETPVYHIQQNLALPLYTSAMKTDRGTTKLTFESHSDACANVRVLRQLKNDKMLYSGNYIRMEISNNDRIELAFSPSKIRTGFRSSIQFFLDVPADCVLYLSEATRAIPYDQQKQLKYSRRNNRPPELRGLASNDVYNLDPYTFVTSMNDLNPMHAQLEEYNETHAVFVWEPRTTYMIPPRITLGMYGYISPMSFREDTAVITVRPIDQTRNFEMHFDRREAANYQRPFPGTQLELLKIVRTIAFDPILTRQMKHGMTAEAFGCTRLCLLTDELETPVTNFRYIETLSNFPLLHFQAYEFQYAVFSNSSVTGFVVPRDFPLKIHSAVKNTGRRDVVRLTFVKSENCKIELYQIRDGKRRSVRWTPNAFYFTEIPVQRIVKVVFQRHFLNSRYVAGTEFFIHSTCQLQVLKLSRKVEIMQGERQRVELERIALDSQDIFIR